MKRLSSRHRARIRTGLMAAGAATAALSAVALWVAHKARKAERRSPPHGRFVTVDGLRVHDLESGEGAPVVLLHGNLLSAEDFLSSGLMASLSSQHRVIAIDRPGFGYSERPSGREWSAKTQASHVQRLLEVLQVRQPIVVGHSWGALVALELALRPAAESLG